MGKEFQRMRDSIQSFGNLPSQLLVILLLEFLNSFRAVGFRFVIYNYVVNEFHLTDTQAGTILGIKGFLDCVFGLAGSILVDLLGVRQTALVSLSIAIVGRSLLAFGRTTGMLYASLFLFSPVGDALLATGLYRVALKKLTTPQTRPLAFSLAYAMNNLSGAIADVIIDKMRKQSDLVIPSAWWSWGSNVAQPMNESSSTMVFTPTRLFVVFTLVVGILTFLIAFFWLKNVTVIDINDPEDQETVPVDAIDAVPMMNGFPFRYFQRNSGTTSSTSQYKMFVTRSASTHIMTEHTSRLGSFVGSMRWTFRQSKELLTMHNTWRMIVFGFATFCITMQWSASELVLPPFLERHFGEAAPIYMVQSINLWGCLILPPIVGLVSATFEDFSVILPGLWVMALSPIAVYMFPTVGGACLWLVCMTMGEAVWSPRVTSWTASLAPTGKEGLFFAIGSSRAMLGPVSDYFLGLMNHYFMPNCETCRDDYGHFCSQIVNDSRTNEIVNAATAGSNDFWQCASGEQLCTNLTLLADSGTVGLSPVCPRTCQQCPGWESNAEVLWLILIALSITSPLATWVFLPFFRGFRSYREGFYGILECNLNRILGICGVEDSVRQPSYNLMIAPSHKEKDCYEEDDKIHENAIEML
mmetsp:Transcript_9528/g.14631  ORF Transcript_9528/g.14631 Transcript_9528/m.14631 type:complete len:640 (+) Transcript_9528:155-2074(+)